MLSRVNTTDNSLHMQTHTADNTIITMHKSLLVDHMGAYQTVARIKSGFYWPGL
jgi:hypothetical protein